MPKKTVPAIFLVMGLVNLILGAIYFTADRFLAYHEQAVGTSWEEVPERTQTLILALMTVAGGGWLALGFFTIVLAIADFRLPSALARWAIPIGTLVVFIPSLLATWTVHNETGADTPWAPSLVMIGMSVLVLLIGRPWDIDRRNPG